MTDGRNHWVHESVEPITSVRLSPASPTTSLAAFAALRRPVNIS